MQGLGHLPGDRSDSAAVLQLCGQHPLLHMAGKQGKQRQHQQQDQRKAGIFCRDDGQNGEDAAGVRRHADDAGGKQRLHGVHIAREAGRDLAGVLPGQRARRQMGKLPGHLRAQGMGHLLAEEHQQPLLRRRERPFQREAAEVEEHCRKGQRKPRRQPVNDPGQQQRREERGQNRRCCAQDCPCGQETVGHSGHPKGL